MSKTKTTGVIGQDSITSPIVLEGKEAQVFMEYDSRDLTDAEKRSLDECREIYRRSQ
jgi:hypothetical protein